MFMVGGRPRPAPSGRGQAESFESLQKRCSARARASEGDGVDPLHELRNKAEEAGLRLSAASFELLGELCMGRGEICARVTLPSDFRLSRYCVHPALLEAALTAVLALALDSEGQSLANMCQDLAAASSLATPCMEIPADVKSLVLHAKARRTYGAPSQNLMVSCTLSIDGGATLVDLQDIQFRPVNKKQVTAAAQAASPCTMPCGETLQPPSIFEVQWVSASDRKSFSKEGGRWLMLCPGDAALANRFQETLKGKGDNDEKDDKESIGSEEGDSDIREDASSSASDEEEKDDDFNDESGSECEKPTRRKQGGKSRIKLRKGSFARADHVCTDTLPQSLLGFSKVVLVASGDGSPRAIELLEAAIELLKGAWELQATRGEAPEIWFALQGTQAAQADDLARSGVPYHAGLWGLARCARREQRQPLVIGCIDVGASSGCESSAQSILQRLMAARSREDLDEPASCELLSRSSRLGGKAGDDDDDDDDDDDLERHVARLIETVPKARGLWPPSGLPCDGWCLVSGGFGGLGLASAVWLAEQGVSHLALLSRSGRPQKEDGAEAELLAKLSAQEGLQLALRACDVAAEGAVEECVVALKGIASVGIKGVLHAAGILEDHMLRNLEPQHLAPVLLPKMDGTLNLHNAVAHEPVELFLLFSSVAAMLGSPGQANYCAANAFLDSFALHRQAKGLPALSLQWGPWAEVGMAARGGVGGPGFWAPKIGPADALKVLDEVLAVPMAAGIGGTRGPAAVGIACVDWSVMLKRIPAVPPQWVNFKEFWEPPRQGDAVAARTAMPPQEQDSDATSPAAVPIQQESERAAAEEAVRGSAAEKPFRLQPPSQPRMQLQRPVTFSASFRRPLAGSSTSGFSLGAGLGAGLGARIPRRTDPVERHAEDSGSDSSSSARKVAGRRLPKPSLARQRQDPDFSPSESSSDMSEQNKDAESASKELPSRSAKHDRRSESSESESSGDEGQEVEGADSPGSLARRILRGGLGALASNSSSEESGEDAGAVLQKQEEPDDLAVETAPNKEEKSHAERIDGSHGL
eukprot:TRINITY_DN9919_c0_g1_i1.p1 TRINITY_DN9919_c0_g1~~TRINITY_DN9919_c0_g1_i1.p1  ORF type:complete len:1128 (+),score=242.49 TRINITY_DN9919_c0_g1_i1:258-3386(+)